MILLVVIEFSREDRKSTGTECECYRGKAVRCIASHECGKGCDRCVVYEVHLEISLHTDTLRLTRIISSNIMQVLIASCSDVSELNRLLPATKKTMTLINPVK